MIKKLFPLIILIHISLFSFAQSNEQKETIGFFQGTKESGKKITFVFKDEKDKTITFDECTPKVLENFDLTGPILIGEKFKIVWINVAKNVTEVKSSSKGNGNITKIVSLELISSDNNAEGDEEPEI